MASRPIPTQVYHFTHKQHLPTIVRDGLLAASQVGGRVIASVGNPQIKNQRSYSVVPLHPGGVVSDSVPFYFAPRSPMMYAISAGQVPHYGTDVSSLVYLVTTIERLAELGRWVLFTRRNAALGNADFTDDVATLDSHVDWALMREKYWGNAPEDGDRRARRMAECLIPHQYR